MKSLLSLVAVCLLTGCTSISTSKYDITPEQPYSSFPKNYGVVVGSFTRGSTMADLPLRGKTEVTSDYSRWLSFQSVTDSPDSVHAYSISDTMFSTNDIGSGILFAIAVPPGDYTFTHFTLLRNNGMGNQTIENRKPFSVPFSVKPGTVNYLGEIKHIPRYGENVFGLSIPAGGHFEVLDNQARDLVLLKAKHPNLPWEQFVNATLKQGDVPPEIMQFK